MCKWEVSKFNVNFSLSVSRDGDWKAVLASLTSYVATATITSCSKSMKASQSRWVGRNWLGLEREEGSSMAALDEEELRLVIVSVSGGRISGVHAVIQNRSSMAPTYAKTAKSQQFFCWNVVCSSINSFVNKTSSKICLNHWGITESVRWPKRCAVVEEMEECIQSGAKPLGTVLFLVFQHCRQHQSHLNTRVDWTSCILGTIRALEAPEVLRWMDFFSHDRMFCLGLNVKKLKA